MIGGCKVTFDKSSVITRVSNSVNESVFILGQQVLKDANLYVPEDQHGLRDSSLIDSYIKDNVYNAIWDQEYAKYQYYGVVMKGTPRKPTATPLKYTKKTAHKMWAHYAKAKHGKEWQQLIQNELRKRV